MCRQGTLSCRAMCRWALPRHMNGSTRGFTAKHCSETMIFTLPVSGFSVVADQCVFIVFHFTLFSFCSLPLYSMKGPVRNTSFILCKLQESRQGLLPLIALSIYLILKRSQQGDSPLVSGVGGAAARSLSYHSSSTLFIAFFLSHMLSKIFLRKGKTFLLACNAMSISMKKGAFSSSCM